MIMLTKNFIPIVGNFFFFNICSEPGPSLSVKKGRGIGINVEVEVRIDRHIRTSIFLFLPYEKHSNLWKWGHEIWDNVLSLSSAAHPVLLK